MSKIRTRIKVIEKNDGKKLYIPQYCNAGKVERIFWIILAIMLYYPAIIIKELGNFLYSKIKWDTIIILEDIENTIKKLTDIERVEYDSLDDAKAVIDKYWIQGRKDKVVELALKIKAEANKIKKVYYIKHP